MRMPRENPDVDLVEIRTRLAKANGPTYWRSLEELAGTETFQQYLHREFPENATEWTDPVGRRKFLGLMGASLALAGVSGCAIRVPEKIVPWVKAPENVVPGRPQFYATAMTLGGLATGLLVESHAGRPTKIEGNPDHPASRGKTDIFAQAETLVLYDPDRSQVILNEGEVSTWDNFLAMLTTQVAVQRAKKGAGLRILTESVNSPSLAALIQEVLAAQPEARWHRYEPVGHGNSREGAKLAFGEAVDPVYHLDRADVILSLDSDFLACGSPGRANDEAAYAARRTPKAGAMNRLYVAEGAFTATGASADHRLPIRPTMIVDLALAIAKEAGVEGVADPAGLTEAQAKWAGAVARDLKAHAKKGLVVVGEALPPYAHALGHAINQALGNIGPEGTIEFVPTVEAEPVDPVASLRELTKDIEAGKVELLLILGGNPAYSAPVDVGFEQDAEDAKNGPDGLTRFARAIQKVPISVHLGLHDDETSAVASWHVPAAHFLESWGDARGFDGTASVVQPLIAPLYGGRTSYEILAAMLGQFDRSPLAVVRDYWRKAGGLGETDLAWRTAVESGVIANSRFTPKAVTAKPVGDFGPKPAPRGSDFELMFRPDPTIWDGRYANNGWLQELPKPITKLVWDNAALIAPATAEKIGFKLGGGPQGVDQAYKINGKLVTLKYQGHELTLPVFVVPGQAEGTVLVHLGYGRTRAGKVGTKVGFNANALRTADAPWGGMGASMAIAGGEYPLATTQMQRNIEGRDHVRVATLADFIADADVFEDEHAKHTKEHGPGSLVEEFNHAPTDKPHNPHDREGYAWGMTIDLNACTGCSTCVIACQAENNIPVIGKEQIMTGRNMQWMEVDTYFSGGLGDDTEAYFQPRTCMHCEKAPCELVCPVAATVHDAEGLNVMIYNRCVGTRYCGNNCPYKVRHFNFLQYADLETQSLKLLNNPDVTVRSRGVMEKCTYCIQRISGARIAAKERGPHERIKDDELKTACQAACPSNAIVFGDLSNPDSQVSKIKRDQRNYAMLGELNTRPRTTYLGKIRNPNPELEA
ncbi:TAT-variant-translocated molybdopterin oxidoreductase [Tundrisphaera sp. TA3]|uniref:TAT-variant-translocated molybdopterin oxidoreductase n=1 Tax=Tundrisphaera sp. TA3 TaxID=3435775 RepID=UPI003EB91D24